MPSNQLDQLDAIWNAYQAGGYAAAADAAQPTAALDQFYLAVLAFGADDTAAALDAARRAHAANMNRRVYAQSVTYLERVLAQGKDNVYVDGAAFGAFVRGGGNVPLYNAASAQIKRIYGDYATLSVLDIGVGDGMALLPALTQSIRQIDLVEPSGAMLNRVTTQLEAWNITHRAYETTIQAFIDTYVETRGSGWDIVQATWSLQSVPPAERLDVAEWIAEHTDRVLLAEFDVPPFPQPFAPAHVRYVVERFERGLAEYTGDGDLVAQGFLLPVMFGYFDESEARTNWEGPIQGWADLLGAVGFEQVTPHKLYEYFWADAYLLDAQRG